MIISFSLLLVHELVPLHASNHTQKLQTRLTNLFCFLQYKLEKLKITIPTTLLMVNAVSYTLELIFTLKTLG